MADMSETAAVLETAPVSDEKLLEIIDEELDVARGRIINRIVQEMDVSVSTDQ